MEPTTQKFSAGFLMLFFAAGLLVGGFATFYFSYAEIGSLREDLAVLESRLSAVGNQNVTYQNITVFQDSAALANIYSDVRNSVVLVEGTTSDGGVQGSGFVYRFANR